MAPGVFVKILSVIVSRGLIKFSNFAVFLILSRAMGAEGLGIFGIFSSTILLGAAAGNLGIRQSLAYDVGQKHTTISSAARLVRVIVFPLAAITFLGAYLFLSFSGDLNAEWVLPAFLGIFGAILVSLNQGIFLGAGYIKLMNRHEVLPRAVLLLLVLVLWLTGSLTTTALLFAFSTGFLVSGILGSLKTMELDPQGDAPTPSYKVADFWKQVKKGGPYALTLTLVLLNSRVSLFLLPQYASTTDAGLFFASTRINELFLETATAIGLVIFSFGVSQKNRQRAMSDTITVARWLFLLLSTLAVLAYLFSAQLIVLLLGDEFVRAVPVLQIICIGLPFAGLNRVIYQAIAAQGKPLVGSFVYGPVVLLNFSLSWYLLPQMGIEGGAYALLITQCLACLLFTLYLVKTYEVGFFSLFVITTKDCLALRSKLASAVQKRRSRRDETE